MRFHESLPGVSSHLGHARRTGTDFTALSPAVPSIVPGARREHSGSQAAASAGGLSQTRPWGAPLAESIAPVFTSV